MKKRVMTGLLAGGLMAVMLPGLASADPPIVSNAGQCVKNGTLDRAANTETGEGPAARDPEGLIHSPNAAWAASWTVCNVPNGGL